MWALLGGLPTFSVDQTSETTTEQDAALSQRNVDLSAAAQRDRGGSSCKGFDVQTDLCPPRIGWQHMRLQFQGLLGAEVLKFAGLLFKALESSFRNANLCRMHFFAHYQASTRGKHVCME